jgi:phosphatidylinositol alpha-1,6-mannosyltransferase
MNVLVTANCFLPGMGGTEVYSYDLALGLSRQPDTHVHVLAPWTQEAETWDRTCPLNIIRYRSRAGRMRQFFKILRSKKIDKIYVTHRAHFLSLALIAHHLCKIPFWVTLHGTEYFGPNKAKGIVKKLLKAQRVTVTSKFVKNHSVQNGVPLEKLTIIPPSLDTERFHPNNDANLLREKLGLNGKKVLVTLCRLVPEKNVNHIIEALANVKDQLPPFHYFILGQGLEQDALIKLVHARDLDDQVTFIGMVPHDKLTEAEGAYLNLANAFILTSDQEPFGICYLEAGACGKPVIAYRSGGVVDIVNHEKTGLLVPQGDIEATGKAITRILQDGELARQLGANARERIETHFSHPKINKRIWRLMQFNEI